VQKKTPTRFRRRVLAVAIHVACATPAFAFAADPDPAPASEQDQDQGPAGERRAQELGGITVTAQKRAENVQEVPISMDVLDTTRLAENDVKDLDSYVKLLPSVSIQHLFLGLTQVYMRGVASGSNGNHSGPLPSVGIYLDEQPITTIQGALDMNIYDVERVESLAGPQGTLYGASSQSGTIRIITNKPDATGLYGSAQAQVDTIDHGGIGYVTQGFVNVPMGTKAALRVVAWSRQDAGYIDNVRGTRTYPASQITDDNADVAKDDYNTANTQGGRAALKIDLDDAWSITPSVAAQNQNARGIAAFDPAVGDLEVTHFYPEDFNDRWTQAALTVQGKIGNFDLVYAYANLNRDDSYHQDYSDYAFWYDTLFGYGTYFHDDAGNLINPAQHITGKDGYRKVSNELRISSPQDERFRFVLGVFDERQKHDINQQYLVDGLGADLSVTGHPDTIWLTQQIREDDDKAVFGEMNFDFTEQLTGTVGGRYFWTDNSLEGFYGFAPGYSSSQGEATCFDPNPFHGAPCRDLDKSTSENDFLGKANLTWRIDRDKMLYATWSQGFRPGGVNRRATLPPYKADHLDNLELGWKTEWLDHHLLWNGAVFQEDWKDFQFAILGQNGLTEIKNANQARIRGLETNIGWAATYNLTVSAGLAWYDSELTQNYCGFTDDAGNPVTDCADPQAPKGTELPLTAKTKGNLTARYAFDVGGWDSYLQAVGTFEGRRRTDLRLAERAITGDMPGYATLDLSAGIKKNDWSFDVFLKNAFDERAELARYSECATAVCGVQTYVVPAQPRTLALRVTRDFQ
jgi:iron complex outermembrane receptor protein